MHLHAHSHKRGNNLCVTKVDKGIVGRMRGGCTLFSCKGSPQSPRAVCACNIPPPIKSLFLMPNPPVNPFLAGG
jgi:hypothetical protein